MNKTILIADDEPSVLFLVQEKLSRKGYKVETARNGREAWEILQKTRVDLIITDVVMPIMDGVDLYKEIKKVPALAEIPIMIITDNRIFKESFRTLGVEHFLPKPIDIEKLFNKVDYIFTCSELDRKNRQVLLLGSDSEINVEISKLLEQNKLVVGRTTDPIDFVHNCLILAPGVVFIDVLIKSDISPREVIRAMRAFSRLKDMEIVIFSCFHPQDIGNPEGIEQLRELKDECLEAGATKYIGRFTPATFWSTVQEFFN